MIHYKFNIQKAVEVVLWLLQKREKIDKYKILKTIFFADKFHLNKYGRPVLGDDYVAMEYGPVASGTDDLLKKEDFAVEEFGEKLPFEKDSYFIVKPARQPNLRKLSVSDIKALEYAWEIVKDKEFGELKDITHAMPEYKNARSNRTTNNPLMDYRDFLDEENKSKAEEIFQATEDMVL